MKIILIFFFLCSYYMEILHEEYGGAANLRLGLFREETTFTSDQTDDAVSEIQNIILEYEAFDEEQVCGG